MLLTNRKFTSIPPSFFVHSNLPHLFGIFFALCLPFSSPLSSVFAASLIFYYLASGDFSNKWHQFKSSSISILCLMLFAWTLFAGLYSDAPDNLLRQDLFKYKKLLVAIPLLYYMTPKLKRHLSFFFLGGVFILIGLSLFKGHGLIHLIQTGEFTYTKSFRLYITEGMFIAFAMFLVLLNFAEQPRYRFHFLILLTVIAIHALFMNGRMALVSLALSVLCFIYFVLSDVKSRLIAFLGALTIGYLVFISSPLVQSRLDRTLTEASDIFTSEDPTSIRFQYYRISWQLFKQQPLLGTGPGSFNAATIATGKSGEFPIHSHTHNEFLTLLSQYGLIGLGLFLSIIQISLVRLSNFSTPHDVKVGIAAMLIFLLNALTDSMLYMQGYFFVFILGLCHTPRSNTSIKG